MSQAKAVRQEEFLLNPYFLLKKGSLFTLVKASIDWMRDTHIGEQYALLSDSFKC